MGDAGGRASGTEQQHASVTQVVALLFQTDDKTVAIEHAPAEASVRQPFGDVAHMQQAGGALELIAKFSHLQFVRHGDDHAGQVFNAAQPFPGAGQIGG
ncbi:hypothetical protein D3C76_973750 [compost metagenome]